MRRTILRISVALITFLAGVALAGTWNLLRSASRPNPSRPRIEAIASPADESTASDQQELLKLYDDFAEAQTKHDAAFFEQNEAEDFILFESYGRRLSRAEDIELLRTLDPATNYTSEDVHVQLYNDAAIVTGRMRATYSTGNSHSWPWIDVCVKRGGRWQILSTTQLD